MVNRVGVRRGKLTHIETMESLFNRDNLEMWEEVAGSLMRLFWVLRRCQVVPMTPENFSKVFKMIDISFFPEI